MGKNKIDRSELRCFIKWLCHNGYKPVRVSGSHTVYEHKETHHLIIVNLELNQMVKKRLVKEVIQNLVSNGYCVKRTR